MHRRTLLFAVVMAISACTTANLSTAPTPAPTRDPGSLNVSALLDLSGSRAPSGAPQRDALQLWADEHATGSPRVRLKIVDVAGSPAKTVLELRETHGSFAGWLDTQHPLPKERWVKLFRGTFRFTGGEIVGEFLMSTGYLPGAHRESCPVYRRIARLKPPWMRERRRANSER